MCAPARVASTDSYTKKKAMTIWKMREVWSWPRAASFSLSARVTSKARPARGGRAIARAEMTSGIGREWAWDRCRA